MNLNISEIKAQLLTSVQFAGEKTGEILGHSVRVIEKYIGTIGTIAAFTILFFEIAWLVVKVTDAFLSLPFILGPDPETTNKLSAKGFIDLTAAVSALAGLNILLHKSLETQLSPMRYSAYSVACCSTYLLFLLWKAPINKIEADVKTP